MAKLGVGSGGSWMRYKDGQWEWHKHGNVRETEICGSCWSSGMDEMRCGRGLLTRGILFRISMCCLTPTGDSVTCSFPNLSCFLLIPGATLWHSEDPEFANSPKWTEDRKEGYRLEHKCDFLHLPLFPLSVFYYLHSAGNMCWALVGSWRRRTSREQRQSHRQYNHHSKQLWHLLSP